MGWSGSLSSSSALGSAITFTSDTNNQGKYTVSAFTAPKKAVYRFLLKGSGGTYNNYGGSSSGGGTGGTTTGYLLLEAGQTVYVGAGGTCSAAFVSRINAVDLAAIGTKSNLFYVAGAGGEGGAMWGQEWNMKSEPGANGGGETGANGVGCTGGTQTAGGSGQNGYGEHGSFGKGGSGGYANENDTSSWKGRGGDGLYGGGCGAYSCGGAGGSGYVYSATLTVGSNTYTSSTAQGGGAGSNSVGSVVVTYYADAELPVMFNGVKLMEIYFNGVKVEHLVYNGAAVFMHKLKQGADALAGRLAALMHRADYVREAFV